MKRILGLAALAGWVLALGGGAMQAQMPSGGDMPDARQMSGMPLPAGEVPPGTVVVRVVRGSMANPLAGQPVELVGGPSPLTIETDDAGRSQFAGLPVGARVKAITTVDGERIESREFEVPAAGGIRVALVATDPDMAKRAEEDRKLAQLPAQPGIVVLGEDSRFVFEMGDEGLTVFNIMEVVNTARTPVQTPAPLVFELPDAAQGAAVLEGSSPQATVAGRRVTVMGPFAPGKTLVQFAYSMPIDGSEMTVAQTLPAALNALTVMAQKVGDLHVTSPQMAEHREMAAEGQTYILGQGPALKAGDTVAFAFTGLPHAAVWPRNAAIAFALLILGAGAWGSMRTAGDPSETARRRKLESRRDRLFAELTALEEQQRQHRIDPARYGARRRELVASLERVYAELDEEAAA